MAFDPTTAQPEAFDPATASDTPSGEWEKFSVPSRPREFVSPEDRPARMITQQRGTREVPVEGPGGRLIYEAGGRATDALSRAGLPPEVAAAGGYLTNLGGQVATTFAGGNLGARTTPAVEALGKRTMQWALKPTPTEIMTGKPAAAAETLLKENKLVTRSDVEKMTIDIDKINNEISKVIANSTDTVNKLQVAAYARRAYTKWTEQVNRATDVGAVKAAVKEFLDDPIIAEYMPVQIAQRLKQGTYRALGAKAYEPGAKGVTASIDAQKDLAHGLKERIQVAHPEVGPLNAREGKLIEAREAAERALAKSEARDKVGFGWLANHPESAVGWMAEKSPYLKSLLARYLYRHADPEMAGRAAGATAGAVLGQPGDLERGIGR
jgi:hypothetical protein